MTIYYVSKNNIDNLYRTHVGLSPNEKKLKKTSSIDFLFKLKAIIKVLFETEGNVTVTRTSETEETVPINSEDRALNLLKQLKDEIPHLDTDKLGNVDQNNIYLFKLPFSVQEEFKQQGGGTYIKLVHDSANLRLEGYASKENWSSPSMLSNILLAQSIQCSGMLVPIKNTPNEITSKFEIIAQFLILYDEKN